jgi:hypothetical protein
MPYKVWAVGEEVLAADFNDYMQEQVIAVFPTTAARDAAILAPNEGQQCYVAASKSMHVWDGTAWKVTTIRATARQQVIGTYDPNKALQIHTAFLGVTADAAGYVTLTFSTLGMPSVPVGILAVLPQVVSTWNQIYWLSGTTTITAASLRVLTGAGAPFAGAVNIVVTILYQ